MTDRIVLKGIVIVELRDAETGKVIYREVGENKIVDQGLEYIRRNIIKDTTTYNGNYLFLSSNTTTPADNETTVPNIIAYKSATKSVVTEGGVTYCQWSTTFGTSEGNGTIGSVAIAENTNGSGEWGRYVLASTVTKDNTMELTVNYRILVQRA